MVTFTVITFWIFTVMELIVVELLMLVRLTESLAFDLWVWGVEFVAVLTRGGAVVGSSDTVRSPPPSSAGEAPGLCGVASHRVPVDRTRCRRHCREPVGCLEKWSYGVMRRSFGGVGPAAGKAFVEAPAGTAPVRGGRQPRRHIRGLNPAELSRRTSRSTMDPPCARSRSGWSTAPACRFRWGSSRSLWPPRK